MNGLLSKICSVHMYEVRMFLRVSVYRNWILKNYEWQQALVTFYVIMKQEINVMPFFNLSTLNTLNQRLFKIESSKNNNKIVWNALKILGQWQWHINDHPQAMLKALNVEIFLSFLYTHKVSFAQNSQIVLLFFVFITVAHSVLSLIYNFEFASNLQKLLTSWHDSIHKKMAFNSLNLNKFLHINNRIFVISYTVTAVNKVFIGSQFIFLRWIWFLKVRQFSIFFAFSHSISKVGSKVIFYFSCKEYLDKT